MPQLFAQAIRRRYGIVGVPTDDDISLIMSSEGLMVDNDVAFVPPVREVYCRLDARRGRVGLRRGLPHRWRRWLMFHALVHHLAHTGNHMYALSSQERLAYSRQERMAELATGFLFWDHLLEDPRDAPLEAIQVAEMAEVPLVCVERWRALLAGMPVGLGSLYGRERQHCDCCHYLQCMATTGGCLRIGMKGESYAKKRLPRLGGYRRVADDCRRSQP